MISLIVYVVLWAMCRAEDYYYSPLNVTRSTLSGIEAYRSVLTLDWLAAEDQRQRELAAAFETDTPPSPRTISSDCIGYARPSAGKIARLMLELLKNLEGDDNTIVAEMIQGLIRSKLLVETAALDSEPDLESLVKTPGLMMGEPHTTFPRVLAMTWMTITDPVTTKKYGWCPLLKLNRYLSATKPVTIAKHMRILEPIVARARFIMEEFIQHVTPIHIYQKPTTTQSMPLRTEPYRRTSKRPVIHPSRTAVQQTFQPVPLHEESTTPFEERIPEDQLPEELQSNGQEVEDNIIVAVRAPEAPTSRSPNIFGHQLLSASIIIVKLNF